MLKRDPKGQKFSRGISPKPSWKYHVFDVHRVPPASTLNLATPLTAVCQNSVNNKYSTFNKNCVCAIQLS